MPSPQILENLWDLKIPKNSQKCSNLSGTFWRKIFADIFIGFRVKIFNLDVCLSLVHLGVNYMVRRGRGKG